MSASDLDLSKAYEAVDDSGDWPWWFNSERIVDTALPHILDALVDWFETEDPETLNGDDREFGCVSVYLQALKQELGA